MVCKIVERTDLTKREAENALNATLDVIKETLVDGDKVQLVGFGSFEVRPRAPRTTINPRSKEIMTLPAGKTIKFHPGAPLKQLFK